MSVQLVKLFSRIGGCMSKMITVNSKQVKLNGGKQSQETVCTALKQASVTVLKVWLFLCSFHTRRLRNSKSLALRLAYST